MFAGLAQSTMSRDDGWRPAARAEPRAGRHDRTPAVGPVRRELGRSGLGDDPAIPVAPTRRTCARTSEPSTSPWRRSSSSSTGCSRARCSLRCARPRHASPSWTRPTDAPVRTIRRAAAWARPGPSSSSVRGTTSSATCPGTSTACSSLLRCRLCAIAGRYFRETALLEEHMSWRLGIRHMSAYSYVENVVSSYNEVRITPLTTAGQVTIDARVEVTPPARPVSYRDYWGTLVHAFDIHVPHRRSSWSDPPSSRPLLPWSHRSPRDQLGRARR